MDLVEAIDRCKELLAKFPKLNMEQIKELRYVSSIIFADCDDAIWESERCKTVKEEE
ncbi:hypothetical protein [Paenibacillus dendritiformis]|uniref:hypothetical protein n=1 Tax=Paenibacillus dendritiformis TaxID=130049 RepID=UPI00387E06B5